MNATQKSLYWAPRILCILAILFVSMFAADAFEAGIPFWKQLLGFLIHLIPSFILTALLVIAWKWELVGGIIFSAIGFLFTPFIYTHNFQMNQSVWMSIGIVLMITFPFILVGALFIASHQVKTRKIRQKHS